MSARHLIPLLLLLGVGSPASAQRFTPHWWSSNLVEQIDDTITTEDHHLANLGQLHFMASNAYHYLNTITDTNHPLYDADLSRIHTHLTAFTNLTPETAYLAANVGQLKWTVQPFYDLLNATTNTHLWPHGMEALTNHYPWANNTPEADEYALATVGQLKYAFSFDPPPKIQPLSGHPLRREIARFLTQTTYGPTWHAITNLEHTINTTFNGDRIAAFSHWIDQQFDMPYNSLFDYNLAADKRYWKDKGYTDSPPLEIVNKEEPHTLNRRSGHWFLMVHAPDQLRHRLAFLWSQIFVVSELGNELRRHHYGLAKYYDMLARNASSTNFVSFLHDVTYSPVMGYYLTHLKNDGSKGEPDQNYAREIMQLFTIGKHHLNPDASPKFNPDGSLEETYTTADVANLAEVFTGLSYSRFLSHETDTSYSNRTANLTINESFTRKHYGDHSQLPFRYYVQTFEHPMILFPENNSTAPKTYLGIEATNLTGYAAITQALDLLANHASTAPFICKQLIQKLITSNPSPAYIRRTVNTWNQSSGNLRTVTKAILLDPEARSLSAAARPDFGKLKEPLLRHTALMRAFHAASGLSVTNLAEFGYPATNFPHATLLEYSGKFNVIHPLLQFPFSAPSVFNFFPPDYSPPGTALADRGLLAPEMKLFSDTAFTTLANQLFYLCTTHLDLGVSGKSDDDIYINLDSFTNFPPATLATNWSLLLSAGTLNPANITPVSTASESTLRTLLHRTLLTPDAAIQQ